MSIENIFLIFSISILFFAFGLVNFRLTLYTWVLFSGMIGIPFLVIRKSHLMFSELLLAPIIFLWITQKILGFGSIKLQRDNEAKNKIGINYSIWAMIFAFTLSSVFNMVFIDPSSAGQHGFILGKIMAWFLYVAPLITAFVVADSINSLKDIRTISFLCTFLGLFTVASQIPVENNIFHAVQIHVGWSWMNVTFLLSFSIAYTMFHPHFAKKLFGFIIFLFLAGQTFLNYFMGTATYKAIILAYYVLFITVSYYRSKTLAFLTLCISIVIFIATYAIFSYYVSQERSEGSLGWKGTGRAAVWYQSLLIFKEKPILGVGPYNYYDYSLYVAEKKGGVDKNVGVITSPHSQYFQVLSETGALGSIVFTWFLVELYKLLKYLYKIDKDYNIKIIVSAFSGIIISRLAIGIAGDYIITQYHNAGLQNFCSTIYFWVCIGVLMGLKKISAAKKTIPV